MTRSIPAYAVPGIVEYLAQRKAGGDEDAARLLAKIPKRRPVKVIDGISDRKAQRREERKARALEVREVVMARAGVNCEWCSAANMRLELHHVVSGPSRRSAEAVETCAAICPDCHRLLHRNERAAFTLARIWAERWSYSVALREIQRRQEKAASRAAGGGSR